MLCQRFGPLLLIGTFVVSALNVEVPRALATEPDPTGQTEHSDGEPTHSSWMGAFWGVELRTGLSLRDTYGETELEPAFGLGLRVATLMSLIDLELFGLVTPLPERYTRTALGVDIRVHPLFIRMLQTDFGSRLFAGLHVAFGLGMDVLVADNPVVLDAPQSSSTHLGFAFGFGLGADIPLTNPTRNDPSLWLGLGWRMRFVGFSGAPAGLRDMDEHTFLLQLGLRFRDIGFMRIPKPVELDDRDR